MTTANAVKFTFDFIVIGAGAAGEAAGHEARRLGASVAVVERLAAVGAKAPAGNQESRRCIASMVEIPGTSPIQRSYHPADRRTLPPINLFVRDGSYPTYARSS